MASSCVHGLGLGTSCVAPVVVESSAPPESRHDISAFAEIVVNFDRAKIVAVYDFPTVTGAVVFGVVFAAAVTAVISTARHATPTRCVDVSRAIVQFASAVHPLASVSIDD